MKPDQWKWMKSLLDSIPSLKPPITDLISESMDLVSAQARLLGVLWACPYFSGLNLFRLIEPHREGRPNTLTVRNWHREPRLEFGDAPGLAAERMEWRSGPHVVMVAYPLFGDGSLDDFRQGALYARSATQCSGVPNYEMLAYLMYMSATKPNVGELAQLAVDLHTVFYLPWMLDFAGYVDKPTGFVAGRYVQASPWISKTRASAPPDWAGTFPFIHVVSSKAVMRRASVANPSRWARVVGKTPAVMDSDELMIRLATMKNAEVRELVIDLLNWRKPIQDLQEQAKLTCTSMLDAPIIRVTEEGFGYD